MPQHRESAPRALHPLVYIHTKSKESCVYIEATILYSILLTSSKARRAHKEETLRCQHKKAHVAVDWPAEAALSYCQAVVRLSLFSKKSRSSAEMRPPLLSQERLRLSIPSPSSPPTSIGVSS